MLIYMLGAEVRGGERVGGWQGRWIAGKVSEQVEEGREDWMDELISDEWLAGEAGGMVKCLHYLSCSLHVILCFQLRAAEVEIKDLQSEFELEKIDYLATIRRQERDFMLFKQLLEQVQPLIRRDCNYSNLEKIKRESCWDEDNGFWKIPKPVIIKTSLPVGQELCCPLGPPRPPPQLAVLQTGREPRASLPAGGPWVPQTREPGYPKCWGLKGWCVPDRCGLEFWLPHSLCDVFGISVLICEMTFFKDGGVA